MRFVRAEELVQLRRLDRCAREHCMRLSAMMDLMLEQMREQARSRFGLNAGATHHRHWPIEIVLGEPRARGDQPSIGVALGGREGGARFERFLGFEKTV